MTILVWSESSGKAEKIEPRCRLLSSAVQLLHTNVQEFWLGGTGIQGVQNTGKYGSVLALCASRFRGESRMK